MSPQHLPRVQNVYVRRDLERNNRRKKLIRPDCSKHSNIQQMGLRLHHASVLRTAAFFAWYPFPTFFSSPVGLRRVTSCPPLRRDSAELDNVCAFSLKQQFHRADSLESVAFYPCVFEHCIRSFGVDAGFLVQPVSICFTYIGRLSPFCVAPPNCRLTKTVMSSD